MYSARKWPGWVGRCPLVKDIGLDRILLVTALLLLGMGILMVYSTSIIVAKQNYGDGLFFLKKQLLYMGVGLPVFIALLLLEKPLYLDHRVVFGLMVATLVGLLAVFFTGQINNAARWIRIAGFSFQPSELAKIVVVMYMSFVLSRRNFDINRPLHLLTVLIPVGLVEILILKEPDFGNFVLILVVVGIMLYLAELKIRYFLGMIGLLIPTLIILIRSDPLRMQRIFAFLNPESHASTTGFQAMQSLWAIGSGGVIGQGIGNSTQKLFFLPYAYSDFIFAIIAEEFGLIGSLVVIGLFTVFFVRGMRIARHADSPQISMLVSGLTLLIVIQALLNISVALCLLPTKGIPLPFISSGGSSLVCSMMITAVILNVSRHRKMVFAND